ncbi:MAG: BACON domain-containing carbohydrate-binding protein, partial [Nitrospirota bacterium]
TIPVSFTVTAAPVPPAIGATPTSLAFTAIQGGSNPAAQTLSVRNTGGGTLTWSASETTGWLALSAGSGTGNGTVTLQATTGALATGTHTGSVILTGGTGVTPITIPVSFTVTAAPVPPAIGATPTSLAFTAIQGGSNPAAQTLSILNTGGGTLNWSASENAGWLALSAGTGTGNGTVTLQATTGALATGSHTGTLTLSGGTGVTPVTIPVSFTVTAAPVPPAISMSPTSLSFTAQQGSGNPAAQPLSITNRGGGTLTWSVTDNSSWISPSPTSGTGNGGTTISVTTSFLAAGTYNGIVTISAAGAPSVTVPVTFTVTPGATLQTTTMNLNPSNLNYAATQGAANPASQAISVTNTGGVSNWTVSDNASWLAVNPASGSGSSTLTASVNTAGLTVGTHTGTLTVSSAGSSSKTVAVTLTVNAPATSSITLTWNANQESDLAGYKLYRATTSGGYGAPIATLPGNVTTFIASGLQLGTTYFFIITAYDLSGNESPRSNEVNRSIY